jgi:hypothetical protein
MGLDITAGRDLTLLQDVGNVLLYITELDHTAEHKLIITATGRDLTFLWDVS